MICTNPRDSANVIPVSTGQPVSSAGLEDLDLTVSVCGLLPLLVCLPLYVPCNRPRHPLDLGIVAFLFSHPPALNASSLLGSPLKETHFYKLAAPEATQEPVAEPHTLTEACTHMITSGIHQVPIMCQPNTVFHSILSTTWEVGTDVNGETKVGRD